MICDIWLYDIWCMTFIFHLLTAGRTTASLPSLAFVSLPDDNDHDYHDLDGYLDDYHDVYHDDNHIFIIVDSIFENQLKSGRNYEKCKIILVAK